MRLKTGLLFVSMFLSSMALAQSPIEYRSITTQFAGFENERAAWDGTGQFNYLDAAGVAHSAKIQGMAEIKIRDMGNWSQNPTDQVYIQGLSPEAAATAEKSGMLYVRYLALENVDQFVVHIFYGDASNRGSQTLFVMGKLQLSDSGKVTAETQSVSNSPNDLTAIMWTLMSAMAKAQGPSSESELAQASLKTGAELRPLLQVGVEVVSQYLNSIGYQIAVPQKQLN